MRSLTRLLLLLAIAGVSRRLQAQRFAGRVTESAAGAPVAGAVVTVNDSAGSSLARTVTATDGSYRFTASRGASLRVIHTGYRPTTFTLSPEPGAEQRTVDLTLTPIPTVLEPVTVRDQSRCPTTSDGPLAFALWEQARAALLASVVAREASPANVRALLYDRDLDLKTSRVTAQKIIDSVYEASRAFVSGRAAAEYDRRGYYDAEKEAGRETFFAPDADVLLDSTFVRGHCLSVANGTGEHAQEVGLAFVPAPRSDSIVDIRGTIWLTREHPSLRSMEFTFTNLDHAATAVNAGGSLDFDEAPNGIVFEHRWRLHIPILERHDVRLLGRVITGVRLAGSHDKGGELAEVTWADGATWRAPMGTVRGSVSEEGGSRPVPDAVVRVHGTNIETRTDASGAFTIPPIIPGTYVVEATDTLFAEYGIAASKSATVDVGRAPLTGVVPLLRVPRFGCSGWTRAQARRSASPVPAIPPARSKCAARHTGRPFGSARCATHW